MPSGPVACGWSRSRGRPTHLCYPWAIRPPASCLVRQETTPSQGSARASFGNPGDDTIWGGAGDDTSWGDDGDDLLYGQDGADFLSGGEGNDIILAGEGDDSLNSEGGGGDDRLWGEGGNDWLVGGAGADFLAGGSGDDSIDGGDDYNDYLDGNDYLMGEAGADTLDGGAGMNTLSGGPGDDLLIGNIELTTFFGGQDADTFDVNGGINWIMDFEPGTDRIDATLGAGQTIQSIATEQGDHLLLDFGSGGGRVWLAWTTLADLAGVDVLL